MKNLTPLLVLSVFTKIMIFPFFYFGTFLFSLIMAGIAAGSFDRNFGETIEGIAIGAIFVAPALLFIVAPVILVLLKLTHSMHYLMNDWLLALFGMSSAIVCMLLLLTLERIVM